ncbi:MAG: ATP-binding protein [Luteolibacter sp.]
MSTPSIRRTLLLRCGCGVGILLCLLSTATYLIVRHGLIRELDRAITQTAALLSNQVELEKGKIIFEWQEGLGTNRIVNDDGLFQFWNEASGDTTRSARLNGRDLPKFHGETGDSLIKDVQLPGSRSTLRAIGLRIYPFVTPEESGRMKASGNILDPKSMPHILVVARDQKSIYRVLNRTRWVLGVGTLLTLGLGFLLIDRVIRVTLTPIDELTAQMRDRAGHQLDLALDLPSALPVELTGLAENFDSLLARVAQTRQRERDFIRHAAHELRTPIAGLRATTDLALSQPRDAAAYGAHLAVCQKTAVELGELVGRLSALSRIGQNGFPPHLETVDPAEILAECLKTFLPLFEQRGLKVKSNLSATPMFAHGDATLLRIIFNNLLDNAISYAAPDGVIRIHCGIAGGQVETRIANQADDLPENLDRLFEPLFREDFSRTDAGLHLGIGLTLSLEAATAMGATLHARKTDVDWIEFELKLTGLISEAQPPRASP